MYKDEFSVSSNGIKVYSGAHPSDIRVRIGEDITLIIAHKEHSQAGWYMGVHILRNDVLSTATKGILGK